MFKKNLLFALCSLFTFTTFSQELSYYLPTDVTYNNTIPTPQQVIYHNVGEYHVTHDRLTQYMQAIAAAAPNRVKLELMGFTTEKRPQQLLIFSAQKNLANLENIRQAHLS
jgi:Zinc carboxypeptidase